MGSIQLLELVPLFVLWMRSEFFGLKILRLRGATLITQSFALVNSFVALLTLGVQEGVFKIHSHT